MISHGHIRNLLEGSLNALCSRHAHACSLQHYGHLQGSHCKHLETCPGQVSVLVYRASSSTGVFAVCLLKTSGYRVVAVASQKHHAWLKDVVGASQVVDYTDKDWMQQVAADGANAGLKFAVDCIAHVEKGENMAFQIPSVGPDCTCCPFHAGKVLFCSSNFREIVELAVKGLFFECR